VLQVVFEVIHQAAAVVSGLRSEHDGAVHVYEAGGSHFRLRVTVDDRRWVGVEFKIDGPGCRPLAYWTDTDLYPVTGPKHGPIADEVAQDVAAWIRAFAERCLLVGCRRGGMVFTVPLARQRLIGSRGRVASSAKHVALDDGSDSFADLVPVQDWPVNLAS
jgi:hypothetical protein